MVGRLPYDILVQIMEALSDDYHSLYNCSLVDQDFNHAASRILYTRIEYSPQQQHVLNLRDRGTLSERPLLASACTPRNALFVQELEIKGFISTRPPPLFVLSTTIADAIRKFTNLSKVTLCPTTFHDSLFIETLKLLWKATHIRELTVNNSCMGNETTPLLTRVGGLTHLTLHSPGRAILDSLPNWLGRLSPQLVGLCLKDNCGSITPGVLRSFLPHVFINLHELTLGLSFSLADEDVFLFLAQLQHLERLELQYYLQLKEPKTRLNLTRLKYFAVKYVSPWTRPQMVALCKWIKRVISNSPIEHIRLICEEGYGGVSSVPFDSIISHLAKKHCTTLRALNFSHAYVGVKAVKTLFESCLQLEEVYIAGRESVLDTFQECVPQLRRLHTVGFNIRNAKTKMKKMLVDDELATKIISRGTPTLRRLFINGTKWEGLWVTRQDGSVHFVVRCAIVPTLCIVVPYTVHSAMRATILVSTVLSFFAIAVAAGSSVLRPLHEARHKDGGKIKPKVFIISMFSPEAEAWYNIPEFNVLAHNITVIGFSPLFPDAHCTKDGSICQLTTGEAEINAATTITSLLLSPSFDLTLTYFMIAGISGVNPIHATTGSVTFARFAVQVALQFEFDAREKPVDFATGYVPQGSTFPNEFPQQLYGTEVFEVNDALRKLAVGFAKKAKLNDSATAQAVRKNYAATPAFAAGAAPPSVVECDTATSDVFWTGTLLGEAFDNTTSLFTNGTAVYCSTQQEDNATLEALMRGAVHGLVDFSRIIIMRTASDFDRPSAGQSAADNLFGDAGGFKPSLVNIHRAGIQVIDGIIAGWQKTFERGVKPTNYVGDIFGTLGGTPDFGPGSIFGRKPATSGKPLRRRGRLNISQ